MRRSLFVLLACLSLLGCKKDPASPKPVTPEPPPATGYNYTSAYPRNLNVVYFVPADMTAYANYEQRLGAIMLAGQKYFADQMELNGYGRKTFGLLKDEAKGRVKIVTIKGKLSRENYKKETAGNITKEIADYFAANPSDKTSDHTLIILPALYLNTDGSLPVDGVNPFFGSGKSCFALDYPNFDIKHKGTDTYEFTKWYGGLFHELGHGLNLPHNRAKESEVTTKGTALMGAGNYTLEKTPTFLTSVDCAVLNVNQVFNPDTKTYYGDVTAGVTNIQAVYNTSTATISVSGKFSSNTPVTQVLYFNDPNTASDNGTGVNKDYNAICWSAKPLGSDGFAIEMPIADLKEKADGMQYELKVKLVHENGSVTETIYNYMFSAGKPVLDFSTKTEISKQGWSMVSFSSEETSGEGTVNGRAVTLIDGNASTYWHSKWSSSAASYPHTLVIDMGSMKTVNGLSLTQRSGLSRSVKDFELQYSTDGTDFIPIGNYVAAKSNGVQYFSFGQASSFRYFKVITKSAWDGLQFASLAELGMY